jgi:hypothetical protein
LVVSIICLGVLVPMFVPKFNGTKDLKAKRHVANVTSEGVSRATYGGGNSGSIRTHRGGNVTSATYGVNGTKDEKAKRHVAVGNTPNDSGGNVTAASTSGVTGTVERMTDAS